MKATSQFDDLCCCLLTMWSVVPHSGGVREVFRTHPAAVGKEGPGLGNEIGQPKSSDCASTRLQG